MWNSDLLHCILAALYMTEKALRMQSNAGWSRWTCHNMDTGVCCGWNHIMKYLMQQEHLILCLNLFMQEGVGQIYPCQSFASSWSLPLYPPSLRNLVSNPHSTTTLDGRTHQTLVWVFPVAPCMAAAWREEAGRVEGGCCHAHKCEWREACATQQIQQPWVPISNKTFMFGQGGTPRLAHWQGWRKKNVKRNSAILKKHNLGRVILRSAALQTSPIPLDLGTGMTRRIMAC